MHKNIQTALKLKNSEKGFALIAAIMACLILLALGTLVIALSTQDIRISVKIVGEKRALAAAEEGINVGIPQTFDLNSDHASPLTTARVGGDSPSNYTIQYPAVKPRTGPDNIPSTDPPYQISNQVYGIKIYKVNVVGTNTEYNSKVTIEAGIGYGPVPVN